MEDNCSRSNDDEDLELQLIDSLEELEHMERQAISKTMRQRFNNSEGTVGLVQAEKRVDLKQKHCDEFDMHVLQSKGVLDKAEERILSVPVALQPADNNFTQMRPQGTLEIPSDFQFPFTPYSIQLDFMSRLFNTIESTHVGIFESPTGTGKSLSLICGSLTWLRMDQERMRVKFEELTKEDDGTNDDWIQAFAKKEENLLKHQDFMERYRKLQQSEKELVQWKTDLKSSNHRFNKRRMTGTGDGPSKADEESDPGDSQAAINDDPFLLDDYNSDSESTMPSSSSSGEKDAVDTPKIIYCSRTHSQLAQFLNELKRTKFAKEIRCVTIGSRQTLCINEAVLKFGNLSIINDRCLQLQKDKKDQSSKRAKQEANVKRRSKCGCPFNKVASVDQLSKSILLNGVTDVEHLVSEGRSSKACPYYASRRAVALAHLVLAPYQVLLHKSTRDSCGLKLCGNILIVDEAHNLLDTLSSIHSSEVSVIQLESAHVQVEKYLQRFSSRLNAKNLMFMRQFGLVLERLVSCVKVVTVETVMNPAEFQFHANIETMNIFKLLRFIEMSHVSEKLNAYANSFQQQQSMVNLQNGSGNNSEATFSPFHAVESFLRCLIQRSGDGRVILIPRHEAKAGMSTSAKKHAKIKFINLNPALFFKELCTEARSVILAGGTMEPVSDLIEQLFLPCGIPRSAVEHFSCGHIVDDKNLLPLILDKGPSGTAFDFSFSNRQNESTISEVGRLLVNMTSIVPGGIVCFFQSYEYETTVYEHWSKMGILEKIEKRKKIFREPTKSHQVGAVLDDFSRCVKSGSGAVMLAVVGGKLSEGINFADDLGRLVVMIGLPFPNRHSVELKEKMSYLSSKNGGTRRGQEYYENSCMRAVNQSIGRVIRHREDYAAILLLDKGYKRPEIHKKLPAWISRLTRHCDTFGNCYSMMKTFFHVCASMNK